MKTVRLMPALILSLTLLTGSLWGCRVAASDIRKHPPPFAYDGRQSLTVVSFNIRVGYGTEDWGTNPYDLRGRKKRLKPVAEAIRACNADVVGLQEVLGRAQALKLARHLNMNVAYADHPTYSPSGPWWGVAILSRYPITQWEGFRISNGVGNSKAALLCTIDVGGRAHHFISIHKDKDLKDGGSFKKIMQKIGKVKGPVVLVGDLNMSPIDLRLKILKRRFVDSAEATDTPTAQEARSVGTFYGIGRIDYVWVDPNYYHVADAGLVEHQHRKASDHLAYWTRIIPRK